MNKGLLIPLSCMRQSLSKINTKFLSTSVQDKIEGYPHLRINQAGRQWRNWTNFWFIFQSTTTMNRLWSYAWWNSSNNESIIRILYLSVKHKHRRMSESRIPYPMTGRFAKTFSKYLQCFAGFWLIDRKWKKGRSRRTYNIKYNLHNRYNYIYECLISHFCKCSAFGECTS